MAANLSLVMDDTDKVRQLLRRRDRAGPRRSCRPTSTRRTTASSRSTRAASATAWAASRAPAQAAIEAIVAARAAAAVHRPVRFLPPRRQAHRQPARRRGADPRRRVRRDRAAARRAARVGRRSRSTHGERAERAASQVSLFGEEAARDRRAGADRRARLDGSRAAGAGKGERSASTCRAIRIARYAAELAPARAHAACARSQPTQTTGAASPASSRSCACRRAAAARWRSSRSTTASDQPEIVVFNETFDADRASAARGRSC